MNKANGKSQDARLHDGRYAPPQAVARIEREVDRYDRDFIVAHGVMTDLAVEAHEVLATQPKPPDLPGVNVENEQLEHAHVSRVSIDTDVGARLMGKMKGRYVTIQAPALRTREQPAQEAVGEILAKELQSLLERLEIGTDGGVLVIGLGNWNATPDAVGPRVVSKLLVTRHLYEMSPPELRGGLRPVAAVSPGVLGLTGIETSEIVRALVSAIQPACVICIDALAARNIERVGTTIQLADTGIHPGSGVGNTRRGITQDELGIPVIAMGVPTVVAGITIATDAMQMLARAMRGEPTEAAASPVERPQPISERLGSRPIRFDGPSAQPFEEKDELNLPVDPAQKRRMMHELLGPQLGRMIVTPKEVDVLVDDIADVLAGGLNAALHPSIDLSEIIAYLQ